MNIEEFKSYHSSPCSDGYISSDEEKSPVSASAGKAVPSATIGPQGRIIAQALNECSLVSKTIKGIYHTLLESKETPLSTIEMRMVHRRLSEQLRSLSVGMSEVKTRGVEKSVKHYANHVLQATREEVNQLDKLIDKYYPFSIFSTDSNTMTREEITRAVQLSQAKMSSQGGASPSSSVEEVIRREPDDEEEKAYAPQSFREMSQGILNQCGFLSDQINTIYIRYLQQPLNFDVEEAMNDQCSLLESLDKMEEALLTSPQEKMTHLLHQLDQRVRLSVLEIDDKISELGRFIKGNLVSRDEKAGFFSAHSDIVKEIDGAMSAYEASIISLDELEISLDELEQKVKTIGTKLGGLEQECHRLTLGKTSRSHQSLEGKMNLAFADARGRFLELSEFLSNLKNL